MYKDKKILGVITARGDSKGIPGKNIKLLGSKPLIAYTVEVAKKSELITDLIVSTDYREIADICEQYGADVPFLRPAELAVDETPHLPVMQHAIDFMEKKTGEKYDYAIILQPTSPFRLVEDIDETLKKLIDNNSDSAVTLVEIKENHPMKIKKLDGDRVLPYCMDEVEGTRRQDLPTAYKRSGAVYAMKRNLLMMENKLYGDFIVGHIVPQDRSVDIDYPEDWQRAESMLAQLKQQGFNF